jgi:hypothetical protein
MHISAILNLPSPSHFCNLLEMKLLAALLPSPLPWLSLSLIIPNGVNRIWVLVALTARNIAIFLRCTHSM